jgi:hypothetical protein
MMITWSSVCRARNRASRPAAPTWLKALQRKLDRFTTSKEDGDIALWAAFLGIFVPAVWLAVGLSGSFTLAIAYNVFRIGPMYVTRPGSSRFSKSVDQRGDFV